MDDLETLIQQMAALGISPEQLGLYGKQMGRGEQLADTPMAQGRHVGNTYVASSPLEHLATAMRQYQGQKMQGQAVQGYQAQLGRNQQGIGAGLTAQNNVYQQMIDELRKRTQPKAPGAPPNPGSYVGDTDPTSYAGP